MDIGPDTQIAAKTLWGAMEYVFTALFAVLSWVVKGIIADAKETKATLAKHEIDSAARLGAIEAAVKAFDTTATRIHERLDELNIYLRSKKGAP